MRDEGVSVMGLGSQLCIHVLGRWVGSRLIEDVWEKEDVRISSLSQSGKIRRDVRACSELIW